MTERCTIQRTTPSPADDWGQPGEAPWVVRADNVPCWHWTDAAREVLGTVSAVVSDMRLILPKGTVITELDRVVNIRDRQGVIIEAGPFQVRPVVDRHTHLEIALERVA